MIKALIFTLLSTILPNETLSVTDNFSISNRQIMWQKVFETSLPVEQIIENIRYSGYFDHIAVHGDYLTAEINMLSIDHRNYESQTGTGAPLFALSHHVKAYAIIDFKKGKYRVTIKSIKLTPQTISGDYSNRIMDLAELALENDNAQFRDTFFRKRSKILNFTFLQITDFTDTPGLDDW